VIEEELDMVVIMHKNAKPST